MGHTQQIISSKDILITDSFVLKEQTIALPSGKKIKEHMIEASPVVYIFPLTPKYEIYLISEYRHMLSSTILGAIGGGIKQNETILQAAKRELEEEAGIIAKQWELFTTVEAMRAVTHIKTFMYFAKDLEFVQPKREEDEEIEVIKMSLPEAVEKIVRGEIYHSPSMTGILMLNELKRRKLL